MTVKMGWPKGWADGGTVKKEHRKADGGVLKDGHVDRKDDPQKARAMGIERNRDPANREANKAASMKQNAGEGGKDYPKKGDAKTAAARGGSMHHESREKRHEEREKKDRRHEKLAKGGQPKGHPEGCRCTLCHGGKTMARGGHAESKHERKEEHAKKERRHEKLAEGGKPKGKAMGGLPPGGMAGPMAPPTGAPMGRIAQAMAGRR